MGEHLQQEPPNPEEREPQPVDPDARSQGVANRSEEYDGRATSSGEEKPQRHNAGHVALNHR